MTNGSNKPVEQSYHYLKDTPTAVQKPNAEKETFPSDEKTPRGP